MNEETPTIDPVCGMAVDPTKSLSSQQGGETFFFCSQHCLEKFESQTTETKDCCQHGEEGNLNHHNRDGNKVDPTSIAKYYCPMCEGVESDLPGDCPQMWNGFGVDWLCPAFTENNLHLPDASRS